jgi:hypothetical protein
LKTAVLRKGRADSKLIKAAARLKRWNGNMKFQFREVTHSDLNKFPFNNDIEVGLFE